MPFFVKADLKYAIDLTVLDSLTGSDDTIIDELVAEGITEMKAILSARYDVNSIFSVGGTGRHKTIVMYLRDIVLYHIFSISNLGTIPDIRVQRYQAALQWMKDVNEQTINLDTLPLNDKELIKYGSNDKRENHQL